MDGEDEFEALRDAEAELLTLQQELESLVERGEKGEEEGEAFRRSLRELEAREQRAVRAADGALEDCELAVEDLAHTGGDEVDAREKQLETSRTTCSRRRSALRAARLAAHRQLAEHGKQQRNALLDGATLRRRPAAAAADQQTAEEEKASKAAATLKLQRMKAEMAAETERAAAALSVFAQSTGTLEKTNDKHERIGVGADKAEQLTTELARREKRDRQMMMGALGTFGTVVIYVVAKRLPFLGHFICAYFPRQFC